MGEPFPAGLAAGVRRVVTGIDARGRAVVTADERVTGDERALLLWAADVPPVTGAAAPPPAQGWWPPPGGIRVSLSARQPDGRAADVSAQAKSWPDLSDVSGFHASRTTDIAVVISGRIWLELDDGVEVELGAGDVLVQNGTRHRWRNHGDSAPVVAFVVVGAQDAGSAA